MSTARIQTYRSSVAGNRPTGGEPGQLYVNWPERMLGVLDAAGASMDLLAVRAFSATSPYLAGQFVTNGANLLVARSNLAAGAFIAANWRNISNLTAVAATAPLLPDTGSLWFDTTFPLTPSLKVYVASAGAWRTVGADRLSLAGGAMTGPIVLPVAPTLPAHLTNKTYVDAQVATRQTQAQTDLRYLRLTGGNLTGPLRAVSLEVFDGDQKIRMNMNGAEERLYVFGVRTNGNVYSPKVNIGVAAPQQDGDAASKIYVDLSVATRLTQAQADARYLQTVPGPGATNFLPLSGGTLTGDLRLPALHVGGRIYFTDTDYMYAPNAPTVNNLSLTMNGEVDFQFFENGQTPNDAAVLTKGRADFLYEPAGDYVASGTITAAWIMDQVASVVVGSKGTYVHAYKTDDTSSTWGEVVTGSALRIAGVAEGDTGGAQVVGWVGSNLAGSWQAHGHSVFDGGARMSTLFRRIA